MQALQRRSGLAIESDGSSSEPIGEAGGRHRGRTHVWHCGHEHGRHWNCNAVSTQRLSTRARYVRFSRLNTDILTIRRVAGECRTDKNVTVLALLQAVRRRLLSLCDIERHDRYERDPRLESIVPRRARGG